MSGRVGGQFKRLSDPLVEPTQNWQEYALRQIAIAATLPISAERRFPMHHGVQRCCRSKTPRPV